MVKMQVVFTKLKSITAITCFATNTPYEIQSLVCSRSSAFSRVSFTVKGETVVTQLSNLDVDGIIYADFGCINISQFAQN